MRPRSAIVLVMAAAIVSAWLFGDGGLPALSASAGRSEAAAEAPKALDAPLVAEDWSATVKPTGNIEVLYKGSVVAKSSLAFWGPNWSWADSRFNLDWSDRGEGALTGKIQKLNTEVAGTARWSKPNVLEMDLERTSSEGIADAIGGGWSWTFKLNAAAFGGLAPAPELLDGEEGWSWRFGPDQAITLRAAPSFAKTTVDKSHNIRTFFLADRVEPTVHRFRVTLTLPEGASRTLSPEERFGPTDTTDWFPAALAWDASPVDLSFLNKDHRPAGRDGFVRAEGDQLVFGDGTPARFWGGNIAAYALFSTPRKVVPLQARRMAQLGYNLMRIHHHDSGWVSPNVFGDKKAETTRRLSPSSLEAIDWWIKCLKDEGIYVWLDLHVGRPILPGDPLRKGAAEVIKDNLKGFNYYNDELRDLMREFQEQYLNHVNPHTKLAYKDDPAVMGALITNENDLVSHFGNKMLPDKKHPFHNALFTSDYKAFAQEHGLPEGKVFQTWLPGPSKIYLNDVEHRFNAQMIDDLRSMGVRAPIATTNFWGDTALNALPSLTDGDVIDVHVYGKTEFLGADPRYEPTYISWISGAQVAGKPLTITEWNVPYPAADRFTAPLYTAATAALQGWDAPMIYNYSQSPIAAPRTGSVWSSYFDAGLTAVMPAAALLYRRGHVAPARKTYYLALGADQFFGRSITPETSATIRTLAEQSRLTVGIPEVKELPWLKPTTPPEGAIPIDDPDRDMIPAGQTEIRSDTGELTRDWKRGIHVVDTARTQSVAGWIGGEDLKTTDARFRLQTKKAVVALTSVDDEPLTKSRFILVTTVARVVSSPNNRAPLLSEPTRGEITLKTEIPNLQLLSLTADGKVAARHNLKYERGTVTLQLPAAGGAHWYVLAPAADGK